MFACEYILNFVKGKAELIFLLSGQINPSTKIAKQAMARKFEK